MRQLIALVCVAPFTIGAQTGELASISGQVVNSATGEPVRKAVVMLRSTDGRVNSTGMPVDFSTITDAAGRFAMKDLDAGAYQLSTEHAGFIPINYGARVPGRAGRGIRLARGQSMQDIVLRMMPQGVISGRVLDEDGDPVRGSALQVARYTYGSGQRQLLPAGGANSNDLGEYRIADLVPGKYYLSAAYTESRLQLGEDRSATPRASEEYVKTFYPGTREPAGAVQLAVTAGAQLRNIDITLAKAHTVRIRGHIVNDSPAALPSFSVTLIASGSMGANQVSTVRADGTFDIRRATAGAYTLIARALDGRKSYWARRPIEVGSNDMEDVLLTVGAGVTVTGRVRVDPETAPVPTHALLYLGPYEPLAGLVLGGMPTGGLKADGTFQQEAVGPDRYVVHVNDLPDGFYVKAMRSGDADVLANGLEVATAAPAPLDIVVSPNGGQISGMVQDAGTQQPAAWATVVLIPQEKERRERPDFYKTINSDGSGRFNFRGIAPGKYKVFAWEDVDNGAWFDPDFMSAVEDKGAAVEIQEGSRENLQVTLIAAGGA